jgi:hypothetical protein
MDMTRIDGALWILGVTGQLLLFLVLVSRRLYRVFPVFTAYILYSSLSDVLVAALFAHASQHTYFVAYFVNNVPEFLLQLGIIVEIAWNVLNPVKRSLPKASLYLLAVLLLIGSLVTFLFSMNSNPSHYQGWWKAFFETNFTFAILRLVIFLIIAAFSQMLGIGWKNHVMQIATGFASYSIITLLVEMLHRFVGFKDVYKYHLHEQFRIVGWCMALGYWGYVLAKKDAPRREFSPRMADFLISISEALGQNRESAIRLYRK